MVEVAPPLTSSFLIVAAGSSAARRLLGEGMRQIVALEKNIFLFERRYFRRRALSKQVKYRPALRAPGDCGAWSSSPTRRAVKYKIVLKAPSARTGGNLFLTVYNCIKQISCALLFILSLVGASAGQTDEAIREQFRAFWVDAFHDGIKTPEQVDKLIADVKASRANAIIAQVRRRADSYYLNSLEPIVEDPALAKNFDALQYLIDKAHAENIEVHAWLNTFIAWGNTAPPSHPGHVFNLHGRGKSGRDYWLMVDNAGNELTDSGYMLDPGHPDAAEYTVNVYLHLVKNYNVDGIHLDFVRYTGQTWGYNPVSVERFNRRFNRTGAPAPDDPDWMEWRRNQVSSVVRRIYLGAIAINPMIKVSAALIAWGAGPIAEADWLRTSAYTAVFQDWRAWLEEGILDMAIPMNYDRESNASQKRWFDDWIEWDKNHRYNRHVVIGQGSFLNTISESIRQARRALGPSKQGNFADGICFYSYATTNSANQPSQDFYRALSTPSSYDAEPTPIFANPAVVPLMAWKFNVKKGSIMGVITSANGVRVEGLDVTIIKLKKTGGRQLKAKVVTDGSGFFGALEVGKGKFEVIVSRGEDTIYTTTAQIIGGSVTMANITLSQ